MSGQPPPGRPPDEEGTDPKGSAPYTAAIGIDSDTSKFSGPYSELYEIGHDYEWLDWLREELAQRLTEPGIIRAVDVAAAVADRYPEEFDDEAFTLALISGEFDDDELDSDQLDAISTDELNRRSAHCLIRELVISANFLLDVASVVAKRDRDEIEHDAAELNARRKTA